MFSYGESSNYQSDQRSEFLSSADCETHSNLINLFGSWQQQSTIVSLGWCDYPAVVSDEPKCTNNDFKFGGSDFATDQSQYGQHGMADFSISAPIQLSTLHNDDQSRKLWCKGGCGKAARNVESLFTQQPGARGIALFNTSNTWDSESSAPNFVDTSDEDSDDFSQNDVEVPERTTREVQFQIDIPGTRRRINNKFVRFSTVHVRRYSITLGDHPLAISYPLSLDWTYFEDSNCSIPVDEFDQRRMQRRTEYDNDYETFVPSRGMLFKAFPKPPQLDVMERRSRLVEAMGLTYEKLDKLERQRKADDRRN